MAWTWFKKRSGQVAGSCANSSKLSGSIKCGKFLDKHHQVFQQDFANNYKKGEGGREYRIHIGQQNLHRIKPIRTHLLIFRDAWPRRHLLAYPQNEKERVHTHLIVRTPRLTFFKITCTALRPEDPIKIRTRDPSIRVPKTAGLWALHHTATGLFSKIIYIVYLNSLVHLVQRSDQTAYYTASGHCSDRPANIGFTRNLGLPQRFWNRLQYCGMWLRVDLLESTSLSEKLISFDASRMPKNKPLCLRGL
jgi:hypothetical protein